MVKCANCGVAIEYDARQEHARLAELERHFGPVPVTECEVVCTTCYEKILRWVEADRRRE